MTLKRTFVLALGAAALLLISCSDYTVSTNIYPSVGEIGPEGGQLTTTFVSNALWTAEWNDEGITVEPASGIAGTFTVTVNVPASDLDVEKTYLISLKAKYDSKASTRKFTITQHPSKKD